LNNHAAGKERIEELDIIRGMAFLAVVLQHATGAYIRRPETVMEEAVVFGILFNLAKFAVPAFVFITGFVLFYNYYEKLHVPSFLRKRGMDILLPYLLWTLLYDIYYHGVPAFSWQWAQELAGSLLSGSGGYHLWFVVMIFQFYLLYPCFRILFRSVNSTSNSILPAIVLGVCGLGYMFLLWLSAHYIPATRFRFDSDWLQTVLIQYRDRLFLSYSFYFLLGGMAGLAVHTWRQYLKRTAVWHAIMMLPFFLLVTQELIVGGVVNLNRSTSLKPSMFLFTVFHLLLLYGLACFILKVNTRLSAVLAFVGHYSYGAYLVHAMVLNYVIRALDMTVAWKHPLGLCLTAVLVAAGISLLITKLISQLPYGRLLIGPFGKGRPQSMDKPKPVSGQG
jgi:surface polysaccharide O-acyltransferase-like enzyme